MPKSQVVTELATQGNNYVVYTFQNSETYKFYFYINAYDNRLYMSIFDFTGNPVIEDRAIVLSSNLFANTQMAGKISVEGIPASITTIDNTCNIYYNY